MEKLKVCRICLLENVRMHVVADRNLQDVYEKLTNIPFITADCRPLLACFICYARLKNCYQFTMKCLASAEVLMQMLSEHDKGGKPMKLQGLSDTLNGFIKTSVQQISFMDTCSAEETIVKEERPAAFDIGDDVKLKEERLSDEPDFENQENNCLIQKDDHHTHSDSEDDVPLTLVKNEVEKAVKRKTARARKRERKDSLKGNKYNAYEIILTKEQQIEKLVERAKSENFTNSPFKCEMCYRGYVDVRAYNNHKLKHDESSGIHECDICHMRYRTVQSLRTHVGTAHLRLFKCNLCDITTHTANQAKAHEKWHDGITYDCQLCSHKSRKPTSYLSHMRKRHPTEHVCNVCGESFVGKHGLQMHKSKTHNHVNEQKKEDPAETATERFCSECNIQFHSLDAWKRHILCSIKHTLRSEQSSQCSICGWRFAGNISLATHMREHVRSLRQARKQTLVTGDRHLRCSQCGSNFVSRSKLQAHINRTHLGLKYNKNIVCEVCGKNCTSNATLKYHQRTHTGEKPYSCASCSKQFSDSNQLRIHTRTHTGEKPYVCAACGKRFSQKPALNRHYRVHTGAKPYTCQYCSRTFSQSNSLKLHVKTVHLKQPAASRRNKQQDTTQETKKTEKEEQASQTV